MKVRAIGVLVSILCFSSCVTTTTGTLAKEKDLDKAEKTYVQIGYTHISKGNFQAAKRPFDRALEINPRSAGAYMGMAIIYGREDEPELAEKNFRTAIRYDDTPESRFQFAVWLYNVQRFGDSVTQLRMVVADPVYTKRPVAFDTLGLCYIRQEQSEEAIKSFRKAITLNRQFVAPYIHLSTLYADMKQYPQAWDTYQGFARLVHLKLAEQSSATLWLGVQLAHQVGDRDTEGSYGTKLENLYPDSREFAQYQAWKAETRI